ncbi:probable thiopurine S-methyltransferase [Hydractinia symbiolongicarpus]|uniref:probable thiopurine S-methyltransferase n=1 Tax=Hydractinia symbiolongicarpus TaxID=13093 RepID=UPI002550F6CF|nr:probable thiopurine S-methyltransferase [Hydractinia symbiolongicarpus]
MTKEDEYFAQEWTVEDWKKDWDGGKPPWWQDKIYWPLEKHIDKLTHGKPSKIFVPCCGNMVDMKWLLDRDHTVIGADIVEAAASSFFQSYNIEHDVTDVKDYGKLYESKDSKMKMYIGDVMKFNNQYCEGGVDFIYDVGAMQAINPSQREAYIDMEYNVLKSGGMLFVNLMGSHDVPDDAEVVPPVFQAAYDKLITRFKVERIERYKMDIDPEYGISFCNFYLCTKM